MIERYTGTWESVRKHSIPEWYEDGKLGIFVHWGIYSVPAFAPRTWELGEVPADEEWFCNNPYAEWYYNSVNVGRGPTYKYHMNTYGKNFRYEDFLSLWRAEKWQAKEWAELFKEAGAQYVILTAKHHDGFCLFPSRYTEFNSCKRGPKRDIMGELTEAVRGEGLKMGVYYSSIIDWQFADDPIFSEEENFTNACPTFAYADYAYQQLMELIDKYKPSVLWNDIGWPKQSEHMMPYLLAHYYNKVKEGVVNDRYNGLHHDFLTKEYQQGKAGGKEKWEMCRGMGLSFGYNVCEGDDQLISLEELIRLLVETVADNGNLLLNIGPRADGSIPEEQIKRLKELGKWLNINGEGIYKTRGSEQKTIDRGKIKFYFTRRKAYLYIFVDGLQEGKNNLCIPGIFVPVVPLDPRLRLEQKIVEGGLEIRLENYTKDMYIVGFKMKGN